MKRISLLLGILISISVAYACVFPYKVEIFIQTDMNSLKDGLISMDRDFTLDGATMMIDYDTFQVSVIPEGVAIVCNEATVDCINNATFRSILQELEDLNAYDLSKEDKDTMTSLYQKDMVVRNLDAKDVLITKLKAFLLKFLGKFICTNYEEVIECSGDWCTLERVVGESCATFRC